ncbi:hypothetical protein Mbo2_106 [Rhodococcus phage Mbo2]|uniref:Uncharacterized protein n=1 Tax=Rhodococcus phage Mbo2 TaxID=2936911 RepID=A0A9E7IPQ4_9CAUD|nr:hypothetical protein Mbo2_106 [Rhodococcus phage Mbo2]
MGCRPPIDPLPHACHGFGWVISPPSHGRTHPPYYVGPRRPDTRPRNRWP